MQLFSLHVAIRFILVDDIHDYIFQLRTVGHSMSPKSGVWDISVEVNNFSDSAV